MSFLHYVLHFMIENTIPLIVFTALTWCLTHRERLQRFLVRWRYRFLSDPDEDGWRARANFERKEL